MTGRRLTRRCTLSAALLLFTACNDEGPAARAPEIPRMSQADTGVIRSLSPGDPSELPRVSPADSAHLEQLRLPWQWIGHIHALKLSSDDHGESVPGTCPAQLQYVRRYLSQLEKDTPRVATERTRSDVEALSLEMGACEESIDRAVSSNGEANRVLMRFAWHLFTAGNRANARRIIDGVHLDALRDSVVTTTDLQMIAAASIVAITAANEWLPRSKFDWRSRDVEPHHANRGFDPELMGCVLMGGDGMDCRVGAVLAAMFHWFPSFEPSNADWKALAINEKQH